MAASRDILEDSVNDMDMAETTPSLDRIQDDGEGTVPRMTTKEEITQTDEAPDDTNVPVRQGARRPWTQYRRIVFVLGCIMGVILAWGFRSPELQLEGLLDSVDMADFFDDLKAALPSALDIGLVKEAKEIQAHSRERAATGAFSVGEQMFQKGMSARYPVVLVGTSISLTSQSLRIVGPRSYFYWFGELVHYKLLVLEPSCCF